MKKFYIEYLNSSGAPMKNHAALCKSLDDAIRTALMFLPDGAGPFVVSEIENAYIIKPVVQVKIVKTYYED